MYVAHRGRLIERKSREEIVNEDEEQFKIVAQMLINGVKVGGKSRGYNSNISGLRSTYT